MLYQGSCHCGDIKITVEGDIDQLMECNCSICAKRGSRLWFVPRTQLTITGSPQHLGTYTFNKHIIQHHFCKRCGCAPFAEGVHKGTAMAAINVRCLDDANVSNINIVQFDGRSL